MIKLTVLMKRNPALTLEQFVAHHREVNAPLFAALPVVRRHVRRYVLSHSVADALPGFPPSGFDGYSELWFDDMAGFQAVGQDEEYLRTIRPDEERFMDLAGCRFLVTTERVVADGPAA